jgi:hypothetical protein
MRLSHACVLPHKPKLSAAQGFADFSVSSKETMIL